MAAMAAATVMAPSKMNSHLGCVSEKISKCLKQLTSTTRDRAPRPALIVHQRRSDQRMHQTEVIPCRAKIGQPGLLETPYSRSSESELFFRVPS